MIPRQLLLVAQVQDGHCKHPLGASHRIRSLIRLPAGRVSMEKPLSDGTTRMMEDADYK